MIPIKTVNVLLQWCSKIILGCFLTTSISVFAAPYMTKKVTLAATAMHLHSEGLVAR